MSLMNTVTKMAIGFAMAKGVDAVQRKGGFGKVLEGLTAGGAGGAAGGGAAGGGGLGGLMGQLGGGGAAAAQAPAQAGAGGGLGGLLGQLTGGGGAAAGGGLAGLGGLLGGLAGARGGQAGGLEALLGADNPAEEPSEDEVATLMLRAMAQAAQADGAIDAGERESLMAVLQDSDPADIEKVQAILDEPVDPAALARDTPKGLETQVYTMSVNSITPDNQAEAQYLHDLAQGLGIQPETSNKIHDSLGAPRLYS